MTSERHQQGLLDINIMILRRWIDPSELPDEMAISAVTLAELSAGPHQVRRDDEQSDYDEHAERGRRLDVLHAFTGRQDLLTIMPVTRAFLPE
jgi:hypothetical protein